MNKDTALLAILGMIAVTIPGRVWYMYFETKKYGKQVKLDDFAK